MINFLHELKQGDFVNVGPKAANLGEMISFGIPVPWGFVFSNPSPMGYHAVGQQYEANSMGKVAVRSSGIAEDGYAASFAGLHDSYLNVEGVDNVLEAVKNCFASVDNDRAKSYRESNNITDTRMAVIVQKMVPAEYAGVMFTKNPVTNNEDEIMIEVVTGLGESLVSGQVTPENYVIEKEPWLLTKQPSDGMLHKSHLIILSDYAVQIENHFKCPQDIEFCISNGKVFITQTRPITT